MFGQGDDFSYLRRREEAFDGIAPEISQRRLVEISLEEVAFGKENFLYGAEKTNLIAGVTVAGHLATNLQPPLSLVYGCISHLVSSTADLSRHT